MLIFSNAEWHSFLRSKACQRVRATKRLRHVPHPANNREHLCVASIRRFPLLRSLSSLPEVRLKQIHPHKHRQAKDTVALAAAGEMQAILIRLIMADLAYSSR